MVAKNPRTPRGASLPVGTINIIPYLARMKLNMYFFMKLEL